MATQDLSPDAIQYIRELLIKEGCVEQKDGTFQATNFGAVCTAEMFWCKVDENWIVTLPKQTA